MATDRDDELKHIVDDLSALRKRAVRLNLALVVSLLGMAMINVGYPDSSEDRGVYQDNIASSEDK